VATRPEPLSGLPFFFKKGHERGMMYISEIKDINGDLFISVEEAKVKTDYPQVKLRISSYEIFPHFPFFISIDTVRNPQFKKIPLPEKDLEDIALKIVQGTLNDVMLRFNAELIDEETASHCTAINGLHVTYTTFVQSAFRKSRDLHEPLKIYPILIPFDFSKYSLSGEDVFLRIPDIAPFHLETVGKDAGPTPSWLDHGTLRDIKELWIEFLKKQNEFVVKENRNYGKISKENITKPDLKKLVISAHAAIKSPIELTIIKELRVKYLTSREKEGFFCDIVGKLAKQAGDREFASLRDEVMYKKISSFKNSSEQ
jgi:hypothetical protein